MPNEFEKIVQQKMEELKLVPSEPVWQKVEMQIRKKRDRRRLFFWIPLLALLSGSGLWIGIYHFSNNVAYQKTNDESQMQRSITTSPTNATNPTTKTVTKAKTINRKVPESKKKINEKLTVDESENKNDFDLKNKIHAKSNKNVKASASLMNQAITQKQPSQRIEVLNENLVTKEEIVPIKNEDAVLSKARTSEIKILQPHEKNNLFVYSYGIIQNTGLTSTFPFDKIPIKPTLFIPDSVKQDTISAKKPGSKKIAGTQWKLNLVVTSGLSGLNRLNFFSGQKSLSAPSYNNPGSSTGGIVYNGSSPVKKDFAFSVGVIEKKQLSSRIYFSTGLQYNYYSNTMNVGTIVNQNLRVMDLMVAQYYSNATTVMQPYHNQYHFVSLPATIDLQLLKKQPLNFHTGLSLQYLIKTNALRFDYGTQSYFHNIKVFNRMSLLSEFGFNYSVLLKQNPLTFGPQFQYGLSRLEKGNPANHLFSYGLMVQWQLSKK